MEGTAFLHRVLWSNSHSWLCCLCPGNKAERWCKCQRGKWGREQGRGRSAGGWPHRCSQKGGAGLWAEGQRLETDGKRGRWRAGTNKHSNPNCLKSDVHGKNCPASNPTQRMNGRIDHHLNNHSFCVRLLWRHKQLFFYLELKTSQLCFSKKQYLRSSSFLLFATW